MCGDAYDDEKEGSYGTLREAWKGIQMVAFWVVGVNVW
jgi:hypothetical protein